MVIDVVVLVLVASIAGILGWWLRGRELSAARGPGSQAELEAAQAETRQAREKGAGLTATVEQLQARFQDTSTERDQARAEAKASAQRAADLRTELETSIARITEEKRGLEKASQQLREDAANLTNTFVAAANQLFDEKSKTFRDLSSNQISLLLKPLEGQLSELKKGVIDASTERTQLRSDIDRIALTANDLANSLRGDSKVQGDWGEMALEKLLEDSGLILGVNYELQKKYIGPDGNTIQPDAVLHMPGNRDIIIDSKVTLTDYNRFVNEKDPELRASYLEAHIEAVRARLAELVEMPYDKIPGLNALDGKIMWVPIESALYTAIQVDSTIMNEAVKHRIYPVGATMFRAIISIIEKMWRLDAQNRSVKQVFDRAAQLMDRIRTFTEAMDDLGKDLDKARDNYHSARERLLTGKGNVSWQIGQLLALGVSPKKAPSGEWTGEVEELPTPPEHEI